MKIEHITWVDSVGARGKPWFRKEDVEQDTVTECASVGFVVLEDDDQVVVAGHYSPSTDQFSGGIHIPKVAITKRKVIKGK